jgi:biopolymer transport protein ExbB
VNGLQGFLAALQVGGAMIYPLLALALVAAVVVLEKSFVFTARTRLPGALVALAESYQFAWDELEARVGALGGRNYFGGFFRVILENRSHPAWWVESRAGDAASLVEKQLGRWLWVLETIVTAAPLLGLLGTITGMVRAFKLFGNQGLVDPTGVTGGVAEALIATAVGLFIALVALFAFNYFSHRQAQIMDEMERLGTCLVDRIRLDAEPGSRHRHEQEAAFRVKREAEARPR